MDNKWKPDASELLAVFAAILLIVCAYVYAGISFTVIPFVGVIAGVLCLELFVFLTYGGAKNETDSRIMKPVSIGGLLFFVFQIVDALFLHLAGIWHEVAIYLFVAPLLAAMLTQLAYVLMARGSKVST